MEFRVRGLKRGKLGLSRKPWVQKVVGEELISCRGAERSTKESTGVFWKRKLSWPFTGKIDKCCCGEVEIVRQPS